eukprot:COSAG02_NODE_139_length_34376_cov_233.853663_25_plen_58_part_00
MKWSHSNALVKKSKKVPYRDVPNLRTTVHLCKPGKLIDFGTTSARQFRNGTIFILYE